MMDTTDKKVAVQKADCRGCKDRQKEGCMAIPALPRRESVTWPWVVAVRVVNSVCIVYNWLCQPVLCAGFL